MSRVRVSTPSEASANEELARAGCGRGKAIRGPRGRGPGPSEGRRCCNAGSGRRWKHSWACLQRPGGCFYARGRWVSVSVPRLPRRASFVTPAPLVRLPFGGPSVPEGSLPAVGWPQRGDLAPGSAGLAPGHQVALNWRGASIFSSGEKSHLILSPDISFYHVHE